jgi:hypothetical protein
VAVLSGGDDKLCCLRNQEEADLKHFYHWIKANKLIGLSPEEKVRFYLKEQ